MAAPVLKCKQPLLLEFTLILIALTYIIQDHQPLSPSKTACTAITFNATHVRSFTFAESVILLTGKHSPKPQPGTDKRCLAVLLILLSGDIQLNPGPGNQSIFPCGTCDIPVTWSQEGVCCNNCSVWYHKSCEDLSSKNMSYLGRSSVIWHCCKCDSINVDSFTLNSFELYTSNVFAPLSEVDTSLDSVTSSCFSPLHTSSPQSTTSRSRRLRHRPSTSSSRHSSNMQETTSPQMKFPLDQLTYVYWLWTAVVYAQTEQSSTQPRNTWSLIWYAERNLGLEESNPAKTQRRIQ